MQSQSLSIPGPAAVGRAGAAGLVPEPPPTPVEYWPYDEGTGTNYFGDYLNVRLDPSSSTLITRVDGPAGGYARNIPSTRYIADTAPIQALFNLNGKTAYTFAFAWQMPTLNTQIMCYRYDGTNVLVIDYNVASPSYIRHYCTTGAGIQIVTLEQELLAAAWNYIVAWYDGSEIGIALNGTENSAAASGAVADDGDSHFYWPHTVNISNSRISIPCIWWSALTPAQRLGFYNGGAGWRP